MMLLRQFAAFCLFSLAALPALAWTAFKVEYWLGLILVGHVVLAIWYSLVVPPWEAHDEWAHFRYAAYVAEEKRLPDPGVRLTTEFETSGGFRFDTTMQGPGLGVEYRF